MYGADEVNPGHGMIFGSVWLLRGVRNELDDWNPGFQVCVSLAGELN